MGWVPNLSTTLLSAIVASAGGACILKDIYSGPGYDPEKKAKDLTVIVTGANSGIGREASAEFAIRGARVFMACRDMKKCEEARKEVVLSSRNKYVYCRPCDLASADSIRDFVKRFKSEEPHVHVLVNNAGVMEPEQGVTREGFETQFGVNHLGHFLLTNLLLDTLKESAPSRVVIVSCNAHRSGHINKDDLNFSKNYDKTTAYNQSKLANVLFARELGRKTLGTGVSVIAVDPGLTSTELTRHMAFTKSWTRFFIYPFFWPFMKTPRLGAQVILHAALDDKLAYCAGDYYVDMKKSTPSTEAQDFELGQWLWKVSETWTRLGEHKAAIAASLNSSSSNQKAKAA